MGLMILFFVALLLIVSAGTLGLIYHMQQPKRITYGVVLAHHQPASPSDLGFEAVEQTIHFEDGTLSPGWIVKGQREGGPTIIVSHGLADSRYGSLIRLHAFVPLASRVVLYDQRGHGDSTAKKTTLTAKEPDDLMHVMNEVDDGTPIVLMGHSMGAGISMIVAAHEIERNDGHASRIMAVICEGGYRWPLETIAGYLRERGWPVYPFLWLTGWHLSFWLGITHKSFDRVGYAQRLNCPLLMINGDADTISPLASAKEVAAAGAHSKMVVIEGGTHGNLPTTYASQYATEIRSFLENLP